MLCGRTRQWVRRAIWANTNSAIRARWKFGEGEVIFSSKDFYSWIELERALPEIRAEREADWAAGVLREFMRAAGVRPSVKSDGKLSQSSDVLINEVISNDGTEALGARKSGRGFLSVTNLSASETAEESLEILSTAAPARGSDLDYIPLHVTVPPQESLLLPVEEPVCFGEPANAPCGDSVTTASAEFLDARREGKSLELLLYAPTRAEIRLRLPQKPIHISLDDNHIEGEWDPDGHELHVKILRGMAPQFIRVLSLDLATKPNVEEREKPVKPSLGEIDYFVANAVRLPTGADTGMRTYPPLRDCGEESRLRGGDAGGSADRSSEFGARYFGERGFARERCASAFTPGRGRGKGSAEACAK